MLQLRVPKVWMLDDGLPESQGRYPWVLWIASRCVLMVMNGFYPNFTLPGLICVNVGAEVSCCVGVTPSLWRWCCWPVHTHTHTEWLASLKPEPVSSSKARLPSTLLFQLSGHNPEQICDHSEEAFTTSPSLSESHEKCSCYPFLFHFIAKSFEVWKHSRFIIRDVFSAVALIFLWPQHSECYSMFQSHHVPKIGQKGNVIFLCFPAAGCIFKCISSCVSPGWNLRQPSESWALVCSAFLISPRHLGVEPKHRLRTGSSPWNKSSPQMGFYFTV